jgi:hypothetical protein
VAVVAVFLSLNSIVKKGVETVGPQVTKVDVKLGAAEISPFSGSGKLTKFLVGNPEGYKTPSAMQFDEVKIVVSPASLMSDTIVISEINIQGAEITLEGTLLENNLSKILDNVKGTNTTAATEPKPKNEPPSPGTSKSSKKFIIKDLNIAGTKATIDVTLPAVGHKTASVTVPALHLQDIGTAENGVTAEQLVQTIMKPLLAQITTAATESLMNGQLKGLDTGNLGNSAKKSLSDLLKK